MMRWGWSREMATRRLESFFKLRGSRWSKCILTLSHCSWQLAHPPRLSDGEYLEHLKL